MPLLDEITMERVMEEFEHRCHENMAHAMETEEGLGIEYDEDVVCDVCQSLDGEDNNEMVFCDKCNICVHQVREQQLMLVYSVNMQILHVVTITDYQSSPLLLRTRNVLNIFLHSILNVNLKIGVKI